MGVGRIDWCSSLWIGSSGVEPNPGIINSDFDLEIYDVLGESVIVDEAFGRKFAGWKFRYFCFGPARRVLDDFVNIAVKLVETIAVDDFADSYCASSIGSDLGTEISGGFSFRPDLRQDEPEQVIIDFVFRHQFDGRDDDAFLEDFFERTN